MEKKEQQTQTTGYQEILDVIHELERKGLDYQKVDDDFSLVTVTGNKDVSGLSLLGSHKNTTKAIVNMMLTHEDFAGIIMVSTVTFLEYKERQHATQPDAN